MRAHPLWPSMPVVPMVSWTYFCNLGWPTSPRMALAIEWPMRGTVPRKRGAKFCAAQCGWW